MIALALGGCLLLGQAIHRIPAADLTATAASSDTSSAALDGYVTQVQSILDRSRPTIAMGDRLLAIHDVDPTLAANPDWLQDHARVIDALAADYRALHTLQPPAAAMAAQTCLDDGLRLVWTGHALLHQAFGEEGHAGYYLGSHGNWDLDLGMKRLATCPSLLAAAQAQARVPPAR